MKLTLRTKSEIVVPTGSQIKLEYALDKAPVLAVRIQELFGLTETPRTADIAAGTGGDSYKSMLKDLPFQRMAQAREIADCAWFLASEAARYISGTVIDVDGGVRWRN